MTQAQHGTSKAVDYSASPDKTLYAPEDGVVDSYMQRGSGTSDAGLALRMRGANGLHQFAHTERSLVKVGQSVKRGQPIALMGHTGYTIPSGPSGAHVHWWIQRPNGTYVYPPSIINESFIKQGDNMADKVDLGTARILSEKILGRDGGVVHAGGTDGDLNAHHVGRPLDAAYIRSLWTSDEAAAANRLQVVKNDFYRTYKDQIAELSSRPTKAQLEALGKSLQESQAKVAEAEKALEEAKKQGGISPEDSAAIKETLSITKWIKEKLGGIFK